MAESPRPRADGPGAPTFAGEALIEELERIPEPAFICSPGGRIEAVNRAAGRFADFSLVGMTVNTLLDRYGARRADGSRLIRGDLPHTRALRGEVVDLGERLEMTLPDGSAYRALVRSTPIVLDGKVVASLSVFFDFDEYVRELSGSEAELAVISAAEEP